MNFDPTNSPKEHGEHHSVDGEVKDVAVEVSQHGILGLWKHIASLAVIAATGTLITKGCFSEKSGADAPVNNTNANVNNTNNQGITIQGGSNNAPITFVTGNSERHGFEGPGAINREEGAIGRWTSKDGGQFTVSKIKSGSYLIEGHLADKNVRIPAQPFQMEMKGNHGHSLVSTDTTKAAFVFINPGNVTVRLKDAEGYETYDRDPFY